MHTQLMTMLLMQAGMNAKMNPQWLTAGYPYLRAAVIEGAEGIEHHGWKWWKAQEMDLAQLQMELVDIWHFALSAFLVSAEGNPEKAAKAILAHAGNVLVEFDGKHFFYDTLQTVDKLELLIGLATVRRFDVPLFESILTSCGMDWNELFRQYVCKNVLNFFRQDNGYKAGTYRKVWNGREDNEHLVEIAAALDSSDAAFADRLMAELHQRYAETA